MFYDVNALLRLFNLLNVKELYIVANLAKLVYVLYSKYKPMPDDPFVN